MKVLFKKNGNYSLVIIPEDDIEAGVLKKIAESNESVHLLTEPTKMIDETISIGSIVISERNQQIKTKSE